MATLPDGRVMPPPHCDEHTLLVGWLSFHRETLAVKCAGIDDQQARTASAEPSRMTLLGLVRHLTVMERTWVHRLLRGIELPPEDPTGDPSGFTLSPDQDFEQAMATWRAAVELSREILAERAPRGGVRRSLQQARNDARPTRLTSEGGATAARRVASRGVPAVRHPTTEPARETVGRTTPARTARSATRT